MIIQPTPALVPLRIGAGWEVYHNIFAEANPLVEHGVFINSHLFLQDLLYIRSLDALHADDGTKQLRHINLGWYPDEDINGQFRLELLIGEADEPANVYRSRDYTQICTILEQWIAPVLESDNVHAQDTPKLVPLRIPTGWIIYKNNFLIIDPIITGELFANAEYFLEELLQLGKVTPNESQAEFFIELGWFPARQVEGQYRLILRNGLSNETLKIYESRDRLVICRTLEQWLAVVYRFHSGIIRPEILAGG